MGNELVVIFINISSLIIFSLLTLATRLATMYLLIVLCCFQSLEYRDMGFSPHEQGRGGDDYKSMGQGRSWKQNRMTIRRMEKQLDDTRYAFILIMS